jgi:hypothetical protein
VVKVYAAVAAKPKVVALNRDITLAQYLTDSIRPRVDEEYAEAVAEMARETKSQPPQGKDSK